MLLMVRNWELWVTISFVLNLIGCGATLGLVKISYPSFLFNWYGPLDNYLKETKNTYLCIVKCIKTTKSATVAKSALRAGQKASCDENGKQLLNPYGGDKRISHEECVKLKKFCLRSNKFNSKFVGQVEHESSNNTCLQNDGKFDVLSRLLKERIILIGSHITDEIANIAVAQIIFLSRQSKHEDINIYINSPGGSVTAGLAIFDAMQHVDCDVQTVAFGLAASMGAFLLSAGTKGKRKSLPNARIMIHQPLGGAQGQASDIEIQAKEILYTRLVINTYLAHFTQQSLEKIEEDCDRDFFMTPTEAKLYGLIDEVITTKTSHIKIPSMQHYLV